MSETSPTPVEPPENHAAVEAFERDLALIEAGMQHVEDGDLDAAEAAVESLGDGAHLTSDA